MIDGAHITQPPQFLLETPTNMCLPALVLKVNKVYITTQTDTHD